MPDNGEHSRRTTDRERGRYVHRCRQAFSLLISTTFLFLVTALTKPFLAQELFSPFSM